MKKRTLCLLLAGTMTLSLLSGCGSKDTGSKDDGTKNSAPPATTSGAPEADGPSAPTDSTPAQTAAPVRADDNPLFDKFTVQFHDVTIRPGMTLGEAVEAVQNSELPLTMSVKGLIESEYTEFDPQVLDQELTVEEARELTDRVDSKIHYIGQSTLCSTVRIDYNGSEVFRFQYYDALPGEAGTVYHMRDLLVFGTWVTSRSEYKDELRTGLGTAADIEGMGEAELQAMFADLGAELELRMDGDNREWIIQEYSTKVFYTFSWNGYRIYEDSYFKDSCYVSCQFRIDPDGNMESWSMLGDFASLAWVVQE